MATPHAAHAAQRQVLDSFSGDICQFSCFSALTQSQACLHHWPHNTPASVSSTLEDQSVGLRCINAPPGPYMYCNGSEACAQHGTKRMVWRMWAMSTYHSMTRVCVRHPQSRQ